MPLFLLRALERREEKAADELARLAKINNVPIMTVAALPNLPGHIVVECERKHQVLQLLSGLKNIRGIVKGKVEFDDIMRLIDKPITPFRDDEEVEIISGPFKGCRARVLSDDGKTVTVELLEWKRFAKINIDRSSVIRR